MNNYLIVSVLSALTEQTALNHQLVKATEGSGATIKACTRRGSKLIMCNPIVAHTHAGLNAHKLFWTAPDKVRAVGILFSQLAERKLCLKCEVPGKLNTNGWSR